NNTDEDIVRGSKYILDTFSIENVLVTRSEKGMTLCNMEAAKHFPTHEVEVYDVSGAGDTVIAVIADLLNQGQSLENAIKQSILASSYVVTKKGTYPIHKQELDRLSSK
ncbi:MAG: PfkB family carbohydrate kinase, partial [Saprospiraceae bacterium]